MEHTPTPQLTKTLTIIPDQQSKEENNRIPTPPVNQQSKEKNDRIPTPSVDQQSKEKNDCVVVRKTGYKGKRGHMRVNNHVHGCMRVVNTNK